jgi:transcriptional regulator GlxA family with amidase domain
VTGTLRRTRPGFSRCHQIEERRSSLARSPFRSVVAFATDGVSSFGVGAVAAIFADRSSWGLPPFTFAVCAGRRGSLRTDIGLLMEVEHGPEVMADADLIILLPTDGRPLTLSEPVVEAIVCAYGRGAIVAAYCTGTFLLAETGLLDGRRAATNWSFAGSLAETYPKINVESEALYVDEGRVLTGAGAVAGVDMCLHLLRREHGSAVANAIAREGMVTPRLGSGQVQYVPAPSDTYPARGATGDAARMATVLFEARSRLHEALSVEDLAKNALMSPRTFARRFREATGLPIQQIAQLVGFRSDGVLREHFLKRHGRSPRDYRRTFDHDRRSEKDQ